MVTKGGGQQEQEPLNCGGLGSSTTATGRPSQTMSHLGEGSGRSCTPPLRPSHPFWVGCTGCFPTPSPEQAGPSPPEGIKQLPETATAAASGAARPALGRWGDGGGLSSFQQLQPICFHMGWGQRGREGATCFVYIVQWASQPHTQHHKRSSKGAEEAGEKRPWGSQTGSLSPTHPLGQSEQGGRPTGLGGGGFCSSGWLFPRPVWNWGRQAG